MYVTNSSKHCGLCRDLNSSYPYKLINTTQCINDIPEEAVIYNEQLKLLKCKSGYILNDTKCVPHCYKTCETCSEYSDNEDEHNCLTCKEGFY